MSLESTQPEQQDQKHTQAGSRDQMEYKQLGNGGIEGGLLQVNLLIMFLLNALDKIDRWRLSTENEKGGKFDDIIFEQSDGAVLLKIMNKKNEWKKITYEELVSTNPKKDDFSLPKYFFSYQEVKHKFRVRNVIICTNAYIEIEEGIINEPCGLDEGSMLYFGGLGKVSYTFHDRIIPSLEENIRIYHRRNLQGRGISDEIISKENIRDFLNHLHFIAGYPSAEGLNQIIQKMISQSRFSKHLDCTITYKFVHDKMMKWFKQKNGIYLNQRNAKAIFCEITSKRYCQILEEFKIFFENNNPFADFNKKILHLITPGECLLYVMRVYRTLGTESVLFVNPDDDISVQVDIIDCFEQSQYTYLVLVGSTTSKDDVKEICSKISGMLDGNDKKKVILVAPVQDKMAEQLRTLHINCYEQLDENISLANLRKDTQNKFLEKAVIFQGYDVILGELLANEDFNQIVNSEMLAKLARNEKVEVGANLKHFNENLGDYYIRRSFDRNERNVSEENMCLLDENHSDKVIIISDFAGMGKSTVLTNMAANIKESKPSLWVIPIDINSYVKILRKIQKKGLNFICITELLNSQEHTKFKSDFEEKLFLVPGKIVMMIDGVDEISPNYTNIILSLILDIQAKPNFVKILVTIRPNVCDAFESSLKVKSFTLEPFSKGNQIDFLCKYWTNRLDIRQKNIEDRCKAYAEALATEMSVWVNENTRVTFAGIPLQTRMLAEIFQQKVRFHDGRLEEWEGCEEFLKSKDDVPQLPAKINLVDLYKMFVDKKRDIFVHDKSNPSGSIVAEGAVEEVFEKYYNCHYSLAWEIFFDSCGEFLDCYKVNGEHLDDVLKIGIVQRINGRFEFIHRTFAEYFVAECLFKKIKSEHKNKKIEEYFLRYILCAKFLPGIRAFLDGFLQKELHSLPQGILEAFSDLARSFVPMPYPGPADCVLHVLSEEGCTNILRFLFKCLDINDVSRNPLYRWVAKLTMREPNVDMEDIYGRTALQKAAGHGRLDVIELLVNKGANVNHTDKGGNTPLHAAVWSHFLDVEKKLVKKGDDYVNSKLDNSLDMVKLLVQKGANVNIKDMEGFTPFNVAAENGNTEVAKFLVKEGADVNINIRGGYTALPVAANNGNIEIVKFLIEKSVNVNIRGSYGGTAIHIAARNGNFALAKLVVEAGADVNIQSAGGFTALHIAAIKGNVEMVTFLIEKAINIQGWNGCAALYIAVRQGNIEMINCLVEKFADIDIKGALHIAASNGNIEIVHFLAEKFADNNIDSVDDYTALLTAADDEFIKRINFMMNSFSDVNIKNADGYTLLHVAVQNGNIGMAKLVVEIGADVHIIDGFGYTALHLAAGKGNIEMVKFLLKYTDVNTKDARGCTALHIAVNNGNIEMAKFLVEKGAVVNIADIYGRTALHKAARNGNIKMTKFMLKNGATISKTERGFTALHVAVLNGNTDMVNFLTKYVDVDTFYAEPILRQSPFRRRTFSELRQILDLELGTLDRLSLYTFDCIL